MAHLAFRGRLYADQVSPRRLRGDEFHGQIFDRNQGKCGTKSFSTSDQIDCLRGEIAKEWGKISGRGDKSLTCDTYSRTS
jgi:hypothetical protein